MDMQNYRDLSFDDGAEDEIDSSSWIERFLLAILIIIVLGSVVFSFFDITKIYLTSMTASIAKCRKYWNDAPYL